MYVLPGLVIPMRTGVVPGPLFLPRSPVVTGRLLSVSDAVAHQEAGTGHGVVHQGVQGPVAGHVGDAHIAALALQHGDHLEAVDLLGVTLLDAPGHQQQRELAAEVHTPSPALLAPGLTPPWQQGDGVTFE